MTTRAKKFFLFIGILTGVLCACLGLETKHSNHLGWALLFAGTILTTIGCIWLGALSIYAGEDRQPQDRSLWLPCLGALMISLVTPLEYIYLPEVLPRNDHAQDIGLILSAGGLAFYLLSLRSHKSWQPQFSQPGYKGSQPTSMIWRLVLCPIPASLLLFALGLGIGYSSFTGLLIMILLVLPGLIHRMKRIDHRLSE